jgi:hypothetical protein
MARPDPPLTCPTTLSSSLLSVGKVKNVKCLPLGDVPHHVNHRENRYVLYSREGTKRLRNERATNNSTKDRTLLHDVQVMCCSWTSNFELRSIHHHNNKTFPKKTRISKRSWWPLRIIISRKPENSSESVTRKKMFPNQRLFPNHQHRHRHRHRHLRKVL